MTVDIAPDLAGLDPEFTDSATTSTPVVRFRGNPSDTEVAAIVAVLAAAAHAQSVTSHPPMSTLGGWGSPADQHRYGLGMAPTEFVNARYSR